MLGEESSPPHPASWAAANNASVTAAIRLLVLILTLLPVVEFTASAERGATYEGSREAALPILDMPPGIHVDL